MIRIVEDMRDVDIYLSLRKQVGWIKLDENQAQRALNNSVKVFTVYDDDKPIGMGRVVGDMAVISYIQDLIIIPEYQRSLQPNTDFRVVYTYLMWILIHRLIMQDCRQEM